MRQRVLNPAEQKTHWKNSQTPQVPDFHIQMKENVLDSKITRAMEPKT